MQYQITHADLSLVLALERGRSLAKAAELLKVDVSTVFRSIRRLESALGTALFVKSRKGYLPTDTAQALAEQAERAEQALEAARIAMTSGEQVVSGTVRLTCTDAVLSSLLLPALARFMPSYPALALELVTSNDFANLSRRDAVLALRLTNQPPEHLVGRRLATVSYLVCARDDDQDRVIQPLQIAGNLCRGGLVFGASRHGGAHGFQGLSQSDTRQQKTKTGRGKPVERGHKTHVFFPFRGRLSCRLFDHAQVSGRIPLFLHAVKPY